MLKRRLFRLFFSVLVGLVWAVPALAQNGQIALDAPAAPLAAGEVFTVRIQVADVTGVYGGNLELRYDPQALEALVMDNQTVIAPGDFFGDRPGFTLKNGATDGRIEYAITLRQPAEPVTGSGTLGTLQFRALRDGEAQIEVTAASLLAPRFEEVNGQRIARAIDEVPVETQGLRVNIGSTAPVAAVVQPTVPALLEPLPVVPAAEAQPQNPVTILPAAAPTVSAWSPAVLIGVLFFAIGLMLFTLGLGTYVRLRRDLGWSDIPAGRSDYA